MVGSGGGAALMSGCEECLARFQISRTVVPLMSKFLLQIPLARMNPWNDLMWK